MEKQTCTTCGVEFDKTEANFLPRDGKLSPQCKFCHRKNQRKHKLRQKAKREKELSLVEQRGMDIYARLAATGGSNIPHSAEVVEQVMTYFGGVTGFSAMLVKQFYDSKPGSSVRNKLLETICRLVQSNVDSGGAKKPLDLWTEEELEDELNARFAALRGGMTINAEALPAPEEIESSEDAPDSGANDTPEERDSPTDERVEGEEVRGSEALSPDEIPRGDP
jgi:hypothetical protein